MKHLKALNALLYYLFATPLVFSKVRYPPNPSKPINTGIISDMDKGAGCGIFDASGYQIEAMDNTQGNNGITIKLNANATPQVHRMNLTLNLIMPHFQKTIVGFKFYLFYLSLKLIL
jgi:hypothetical protein